MKSDEFMILEDIISSSSTRGGWTYVTIDSTTGSGMYTSIVTDSNDRPHISYYDAVGKDLRYTSYDGVRWQIVIIDSNGDVGEYTSITIDSNDRQHISYYDRTNGDLKYAYFNGTGWDVETVDSSADIGWYTSIVTDSQNRPHISYYHNIPGMPANGNLKYAYHNGVGWQIETIDTPGDVGEDTSIEVDSNDRPRISYRDNSNTNLNYAYHDGAQWHKAAVDQGGTVGYYTSLELDTNDRPHISYFDLDNENLKYTYNDGAQWQTETVDSNGRVGTGTSLSLDTNNRPHISYTDDTNDDLKYAYHDGAQWQITTLDSADVVGWFSSIAMDSNDRPHISYFDTSHQNLKYASIDNNPPALVADNSPNTGTTGDLFILNISASDDVFVGQVHVNWSHGGRSGNDSMMLVGSFWIRGITLEHDLTDLSYTIYITDGVGNNYSGSPKTVPVIDNDAPALEEDLTADAVTPGENTTLMMNASDNVAVVGARAIYTFDDTDFENETMVLDGLGYWNKTISIPLDSPFLKYRFYIYDEAENYLTTSEVEITVPDNTLPVFIGELTTDTARTGEPMNISADFTDNVKVFTVLLLYTFDGMDYQVMVMEDIAGDTWKVTIDIPQNVSTMDYYFIAKDYMHNELNTANTVGEKHLDVTDIIRPAARCPGELVVFQFDNITFSGNRSSDNIGIVNYTWSFEYEGEQIMLYGMVADFVFEYAVSYNITLNVTDGNGNWDTDHFIITVWDITKPKAEAGTDAVIDQHDSINFNGNKSIDDKGIVNYTWSFVYDGRTERFYGVEMSFVFDTSGTYNVNLKVFDENGNWDTDQLVLTVRDITPPEADAGEYREIKQGTEITLDGIASIDNVGIVNYTWSFDYNGSAVSLYGPSVIFRFDTPENYTITLTVADAMDNRDTDTTNILVVPEEKKPNVTDDDVEDDDVIPADDDENESRIESWLRRSHLSFSILATILIALLFLSIALYFILRKTRKKQAELEEAERRKEEVYDDEEEIEETRRRSSARRRKRTVPSRGKRDGGRRGERRARRELEDAGDADDWIVFEGTHEEKKDAGKDKRRPKERRKPKRKQKRRRRYEDPWDDDETEEEYIADFDDDDDDEDGRAPGRGDEEWDEDLPEEADDDTSKESYKADTDEEQKDEWDSFWDDVDEEETQHSGSKESAVVEKKTVLKKKKKKKKIKKHGSGRRSSQVAGRIDTSDDDDMWVS